MTSIVDEKNAQDAPPLRKLSEEADGESQVAPEAATGVGEASPVVKPPPLVLTPAFTFNTPPASPPPSENHVQHHIAFDDADQPAPVELHRPRLPRPSVHEIELAAKLGISADVVSNYGSAPGTPTTSRQSTGFRPILKGGDHYSHNHAHFRSSSPTPTSGPGTPDPSASDQHHEPRRRVSIVVSEDYDHGKHPSKKLSTCSCEWRASFRSIGRDHGRDSLTTGTGPTKKLSTCSCDGRLSLRSAIHDGTAIAAPPPPSSPSKTTSPPGTPLASSKGKHHELENGNTPADVQEPSKHKSFLESIYNKIYPQRSIKTSAWYLFCQRCRKEPEEEAEEPWEPPHWQTVCPYPFCPTYRQFARVTGITLVLILLWGCAYAVVGPAAAPGGQLFGLALLTIAAHFGGWLIALTTLPALIGMLLVGILFQNVGLFTVSGEYLEVTSILRKIALVIILTRAGLDLDPPALRRLFFTVLKLGLVPWLVDCVVVAVMTHFLLELPWIWGFLLGAVVAAVSPAVVVPCLIRLRSKGYGVAKGIPTLIIAVSGIDDAASVAMFGIIHSIMFSNDSLAYQIVQGPLSIVIGVGFGILWGLLAKYVPEKNDPFVVPLRVLLLFGAGLISVLGSESVGLGGAGPLAVVAAAFVSCYSWTKHGWEVEDNPVATAFEIFWMIFEPILFGLTGAQIKFDELDPHKVSIILACLITAIVLRIICTILIAFKNKLNLKEKVFISVAFMSKASVQAALAPVVLDSVRETGTLEDDKYAHDVLVVCILSIILSAPLSAMLITILGPRLLTKTTIDPQFPENWRRHTRPSLRDITIIDEDDETADRDDAESGTITPSSSIKGSGRRRRRSTRSSNQTSTPAPIDTIS